VKKRGLAPPPKEEGISGGEKVGQFQGREDLRKKIRETAMGDNEAKH